MSLQTDPLKVIEKKTNLEENLLSGTTPEDTSIPSSINVIGQENASDKVSIKILKYLSFFFLKNVITSHFIADCPA